jgi:hypothetical protein
MAVYDSHWPFSRRKNLAFSSNRKGDPQHKVRMHQKGCEKIQSANNNTKNRKESNRGKDHRTVFYNHHRTMAPATGSKNAKPTAAAKAAATAAKAATKAVADAKAAATAAKAATKAAAAAKKAAEDNAKKAKKAKKAEDDAKKAKKAEDDAKKAAAAAAKKTAAAQEKRTKAEVKDPPKTTSTVEAYRYYG